MKKTPFIIGLSLAAILSLTGCGNNTSNDAATIDKLSGQLDRVVNTVSAITTLDDSDASVSNLSKKFDSTASLSKLSSTYQSAKIASSNIETNKQKILRKVKLIKRDLAGGVKLGNENVRAISELTSAMQRYTTNLNKTKSDYRNTIGGISKLSNLEGSEIEAKITRLSCCVEARDCYMNNILCTLDNIQSILDGLEKEDEDKTETPAQDKEIKKPLDEEVKPEPETEKPQENKDYLDNHDDGNYLDRHDGNVSNVNNEVSEPAANPGYNFNGANGGYGFYPNGYNGAYGNGVYGNAPYRNSLFNPNRNTDTYGPGITNIDTYRNYGNGMYEGGAYGYGNGRHFGGSNGVNNVAEPEIDEELLPAEDAEDIKADVTEEKTETQEKKIVEAKLSEVKKPIKEVNGSQNKKPTVPAKALDKQIEKEEDKLKVKSVQTENVSEELAGEDKVKGHTQTVAALADVNQTIEELIKD